MANFYAEDMVNKMIDNEKIEVLLPKINEFYNNIFSLIYTYSHRSISAEYIAGLLLDDTNKIAFRCINMEFEMENCPSILIYRKYYKKDTNEIIYYMLMICTKQKFKKFGYASKLLDDFIQYIKNKYTETKNNYHIIKIVLSSVESAVTFYESYGFKWLRNESITSHKVLMRYEKYEEDKEYYMMELCI
jgi:ribosomal protein S18 acetylase RimI-like enzyme